MHIRPARCGVSARENGAARDAPQWDSDPRFKKIEACLNFLARRSDAGVAEPWVRRFKKRVHCKMTFTTFEFAMCGRGLEQGRGARIYY